jgi:quinol monooxygenase YgiN
MFAAVAGIVVIVAYRPKPEREADLLELVRARVPTLQKENLVTDREPVIMRAKDGTIIEVSEWTSREAIEEAHKNPRVLAMWDKFFAVCDCVPLKQVAETETMFAGFEPIPAT